MNINRNLFLAVLIAAISWGLGRSAPAQDLRITEAMSSSGTGGTADWFELTNYGVTMAFITGWKVDDSSFSFAASVALNGVTSIAAGESVLFVEGAGGTAIDDFRAFWGGIGTIQIGSYTGSGISLSATSDGVVLFDAVGAEVTPRVTFGAATTGASFFYAYDAAGNPATSPNSAAVVSTVGLLDGQTTFASANALGNIGSPGTATNAVPEPSTAAFLSLGAAWLLGSVRRRFNAKS
jgi:hypothetical protein